MDINEPIKSKRVPRFVEEYAKDRNGTQAVIRAGYSANGADVTACRLLADPRILKLVEEEVAKVSSAANVEAADVLREWFMIATADPGELMRMRRLNCRYCNGLSHAYQWSSLEYAKACDDAMTSEKPKAPPDCDGGFGWCFNADPNPECPQCHGEGLEDVYFEDTAKLGTSARKLFAGIKRTREGLEIKTRDQDAALLNIAKYLGMLVEKREVTGKGGKDLVPPNVPVELPKDPVALAALYSQVMGS